MSRLGIVLAACIVMLMTSCASLSPSATSSSTMSYDDVVAEESAPSHGIGHRLLFYIPNRIFDVFDIVRARVRLGPGFGIGVRATELADFNLSAYTAIWVGIHGYRGEPSIPWPVGAEAVAKAEISIADAEASAGGPLYGPVEFGLGFHAALLGVDVGIEPWEIVDLVLGLFTFDPVGDDF